MKIENLHRLFRLNSILILCYLVILFLLVFVVDFRLNLIEIPGAMYLESKSLFPVQAFNSITVTILIGTFLLILNIPAVFNIIKTFLENKDIDHFYDLRKRHIFIYYYGYGILHPHRIWWQIKEKTLMFKIAAIFFYFYMIFILLYWMFGWTFVNIPPPHTLVVLISKFKAILYLLNVVIFCSTSFLLLSVISGIFLIIYSFIDIDEEF